jgi:hypothetical protein
MKNVHSHQRMVSQPPRVSSSIILEPIQRPTKQSAYFKSFSGQEDYEIDKDPQKLHNETRKSPRKDLITEKRTIGHHYKIRSPRNMLFS